MLAVSVVIPWGKRAGDAKRSIESALAQTIAPEEILAVPNGPIDLATANRTLETIQKDSKGILRFIDGSRVTNANGARNLGVQAAKGDWIAFLDSDDWWSPDHLERSLAELRRTGAKFCYGSMVVHRSDRTFNMEAEHFSTLGGPENYLLHYKPAPTPSYVLEAEAARAHLWNESLHRHQDYELFVRLCTDLEVCVNREPTVHVDWVNPATHHHHLDCLRVVLPWKSKVDRAVYHRHIKRLAQSARRSRDPAWFLLMLERVHLKVRRSFSLGESPGTSPDNRPPAD